MGTYNKTKKQFKLFFNSRVVLATGFIHILPDAMETLSDPCLPDSWTVFGAYGGLFAMLATLAMQLIEFLAHQRYRSMKLKHAHVTVRNDVKACTVEERPHGKVNDCINNINNTIDKIIFLEHVHDENENPEAQNHIHDTGEYNQNTKQAHDHINENGGVDLLNETNRKRKKKKSHNTEINNLESNHESNHKTEEPEQILQTSDEIEKHHKTHDKNHNSHHAEEGHNHSHELGENHPHHHHDVVSIEIVDMEPSPANHCEESGHHHGLALEDDSHGNKISTYLLELGIALHSVLIGLTLGTTTESFVALFIALCFHQFFEAIALGAQIANLKTTSLKSAIFMVIFFSLTTPVGIAIGIGIHSGTYNPKSVSSLLVTGILDSLSAGVLIYVALVNLITAEMGANAHSFYTLRTRLKFLYYAALYLGVAAMTVIGRWA